MHIFILHQKNDSILHKLNYDKRKFYPPEYKIGDLVNITDKRNVFSKRDATNWSYELSKFYEMVNFEPPQYLIENEQGEKILGKNYEPGLL